MQGCQPDAVLHRRQAQGADQRAGGDQEGPPPASAMRQRKIYLGWYVRTVVVPLISLFDDYIPCLPCDRLVSDHDQLTPSADRCWKHAWLTLVLQGAKTWM
jgi:hypothetical protein